MKYLDWNAVFFVGVTLIHEYWLYWGLPQIEYWETKRMYNSMNNDKDDSNKAA
ncbi:hypothetical protein ABRT01_08390 [Lentibacillus sp. L22]|uniref:hypothetical protein n=1 Tax=Lentibacillus TaxID=175304 RepID=UPI0022B19BAC|nr:hypothetical protein [Lentibacillus daqui]